MLYYLKLKLALMHMIQNFLLVKPFSAMTRVNFSNFKNTINMNYISQHYVSTEKQKHTYPRTKFTQHRTHKCQKTAHLIAITFNQ